ncbi:MAG: cyclic nucleotide-binding domain-containing protein [Spirochaetes bacterium]|nr:cyclic nucleotide-binding domain-containing protein [Spirochaetota bacterium]
MIGVLLRFFRKNLSVLLRTPVFNIIMAASPRERMIKIKSFINGVVNPAGMIAGGLSIMMIYKKMTDVQGYIFTISLGIIYLFLVYAQNGNYIKALKDRIKFNKKFSEEQEKIDWQNYAEFFDDSNVEKNFDIIESVFESNPNQDFLSVIISNYNKLSVRAKEITLDLMKTGTAVTDHAFLGKSLKDKEPEIRALALSLLSMQPREVIKRALKENLFSNRLKGEQIAAAILLSEKRNNTQAGYISQLIEVKNLVLKGKLDPVEFVMIINVLKPDFALDHLYELTIKNKETILLKSMIQFADKLTRRRIVKLMYIFRNESLDYLARFIMLASNIEETDKLMLLDCREIPESYMKSIFSYDEKSSGILIKKLFKNLSYNRKSNYLKYLLTQNVIFEAEFRSFIDFEIIRIKSIYDLIDSLHLLISDKNSPYLRFLNIFLQDVIAYKKHLILKVISILTGLKIDEVYDSNILLGNRDLDNYILEYIDSSLKHKHSEDLISVFEYRKSQETASKSGRKSSSVSLVEYEYLYCFLPEVKSLVQLSFGQIVNGEDSYNNGAGRQKYLTEEVKMSLSIMQKILFLKENKLFNELKINEIIHIAGIAREIDIPAGSTIIKQGENGDRLFIVIEGEVKVFTEQRILANLGPGSCIGELSIIDAEPRSASVVSTKKTKILSIARDDFLLTLKDNPAISINIMQVITGRLRKMI